MVTLMPPLRRTRPDPVTHDYRRSRCTIGWDYTFDSTDGGKYARMIGWSTDPRTGHVVRLAAGDFVLFTNLKSDNGETRYQIEQIKYYRDPRDMFSAQLVWAPRKGAEDER